MGVGTPHEEEMEEASVIIVCIRIFLLNNGIDRWSQWPESRQLRGSLRGETMTRKTKPGGVTGRGNLGHRMRPLLRDNSATVSWTDGEVDLLCWRKDEGKMRPI
jgi:hypothetical protein